jgi:hypothetical protein
LYSTFVLHNQLTTAAASPPHVQLQASERLGPKKMLEGHLCLVSHVSQGSDLSKPDQLAHRNNGLACDGDGEGA